MEDTKTCLICGKDFEGNQCDICDMSMEDCSHDCTDGEGLCWECCMENGD